MQNGENFELKIDNVSFAHMLAQEKCRQAFIYDGAVQPT